LHFFLVGNDVQLREMQNFAAAAENEDTEGLNAIGFNPLSRPNQFENRP